jgi:hypothetical protein
VHLSVLNCPVTAFFTDYVVALQPVLMEKLIICAFVVSVILVVAILIQGARLDAAMRRYEKTHQKWKSLRRPK